MSSPVIRGIDSLPLELLHIILENMGLTHDVKKILNNDPLAPFAQSKHSPHLRLRASCPALRTAVDTYRHLWSYLCVDWTDPSAHKVAELWFKNGRRFHLYVLREKGKELENDKFQEMPHVKALVNCLKAHKTSLKSAVFMIPGGVDAFRSVFEDCLERQVPHLLYQVTVPMGGGSIWQSVKDEERTVILGVADTPHGSDLLGEKLHPSRLGRTERHSNEHPCRSIFFPINWERVTTLSLVLDCDSLSLFQSLLASDGARAQLLSLDMLIEPQGPLNPEWSVKQDLTIHLPRLESLAFSIQSGIDRSPAEDNWNRIMDFMGSLRCPALQSIRMLCHPVDMHLAGGRDINLSKLLCITDHETTASPLMLERLDIHANFDTTDLCNVLQRAGNLKYLAIQAYHMQGFKQKIMGALTNSAQHPRGCACPKLEALYLVSFYKEDVEDLIFQFARSRFGGGYYSREALSVENGRLTQSFVGSSGGQELVVLI